LANIKDWWHFAPKFGGDTKFRLEGEDSVSRHVVFFCFVALLQLWAGQEKTKDLKTFYPTSVLSTARDIINLGWQE